MLGIQVCGQQSPLKPRARWWFAAAKLDFGSCLLGSIPHTSVKLNCQKHGAFQVDGWTWDIASFAVLSRIFRGSFAKFGCQNWQVQILNLNWALATVFNALYNPSCDTWLPQLRPYLLCQLPVHSHRSIPNEQNKQFEISWTSLSRPFAKQITFAIFRDPAFLFRESDVVQLPYINNTLRFFSWLTWQCKKQRSYSSGVSSLALCLLK